MFTGDPNPLGDKLQDLRDELVESHRRGAGLALVAAARTIRKRLPTARTFGLQPGEFSDAFHLVRFVILEDGYVVNRCELERLGWRDTSFDYHSVPALEETGLAEPGGPVTVDQVDGTRIVDIDALLRIPLGLWYPRRPGEPQLGPVGHRNAVLAAIFPPAIPAPTAPANDLANA